MNKTLKLFILLLTFVNIIFCAWFVLHNEIHYTSDIARDFLLYTEIDEKKLVLIGPRSSTSGLFHGPLWMYLNYPAYYIGNGNPVVVGWFWVLLTVSFLVSCFYVAKKLFDETTGYLFVLLLSTQLVFHTQQLFNPHGTLFLVPIFLYLFIRYITKTRLLDLLLFVFVSGLMIQFQMAVGIPLLLLGSLPILYTIIKKKKFLHIFAFGIMLIPLSTFILFDVRHEFIQLRSALGYVNAPNTNKDPLYSTFGALVVDRFKFVTASGIQVLRYDVWDKYIFVLLAVLFFFQMKDKRHRIVYLTLAYFYIGFFALSLLNKGVILYHQYFSVFPIVFLMIASVATAKKYKNAFVFCFIVIYVLATIMVVRYIQESSGKFGKSQVSWKAYYDMAQTIYAGPEKEFGYLVYSPDVVGYQARYAMMYGQKAFHKNGYLFQKHPVTYLIIAPTPPDRPELNDRWWKENKAKIASLPLIVQKYPSGYIVEKYTLTGDDLLPPASDIDAGLHYR